MVVLLLSLAGVPDLPLLAQETPGISSPGPGAAINGDVPILGTAIIDSFQKYELAYKQEPSGDDAYIYFAGGTAPVVNGQVGVWSAGGLPPGVYSIRLRVVKADGNYAEYFAPNLSVNQAAPTPTPTETPSETATPTETFTPAPQPTPVIGQVAQPAVEGDEPPTATPAPAAPEAPAEAAGLGNLLPTPTPIGANGGVAPAEGDSLSRELGEAVGMDRLRTHFVNGVRISAAVFIGLAALLAGKRLFEWGWRKYS